jgi:hypothetical protein
VPTCETSPRSLSINLARFKSTLTLRNGREDALVGPARDPRYPEPGPQQPGPRLKHNQDFQQQSKQGTQQHSGNTTRARQCCKEGRPRQHRPNIAGHIETHPESNTRQKIGVPKPLAQHRKHTTSGDCPNPSSPKWSADALTRFSLQASPR